MSLLPARLPNICYLSYTDPYSAAARTIAWQKSTLSTKRSWDMCCAEPARGAKLCLKRPVQPAEKKAGLRCYFLTVSLSVKLRCLLEFAHAPSHFSVSLSAQWDEHVCVYRDSCFPLLSRKSGMLKVGKLSFGAFSCKCTHSLTHSHILSVFTHTRTHALTHSRIQTVSKEWHHTWFRLLRGGN